MWGLSVLGSWGAKFRMKILKYTAETWEHLSSCTQESCSGIHVIVLGRWLKNGANAVEIPLHWWGVPHYSCWEQTHKKFVSEWWREHRQENRCLTVLCYTVVHVDSFPFLIPVLHPVPFQLLTVRQLSFCWVLCLFLKFCHLCLFSISFVKEHRPIHLTCLT